MKLYKHVDLYEVVCKGNNDTSMTIYVVATDIENAKVAAFSFIEVNNLPYTNDIESINLIASNKNINESSTCITFDKQLIKELN